MTLDDLGYMYIEHVHGRWHAKTTNSYFFGINLINIIVIKYFTLKT